MQPQVAAAAAGRAPDEALPAVGVDVAEGSGLGFRGGVIPQFGEAVSAKDPTVEGCKDRDAEAIMKGSS